MKFIIPDTIEIVPKHEAALMTLPNIWPLGTLFRIKSNKICFRFMTVGGRWNTEYVISTPYGFMRKGHKFSAKGPIEDILSYTHKIDAVTDVVKYLDFPGAGIDA